MSELTPEQLEIINSKGHLEISSEIIKDDDGKNINISINNTNISESAKENMKERLTNYFAYQPRFKVYLEIIDEGDLMNPFCEVYKTHNIYELVKQTHNDIYAALYGGTGVPDINTLLFIEFTEDNAKLCMRDLHNYLKAHSQTYASIIGCATSQLEQIGSQ